MSISIPTFPCRAWLRPMAIALGQSAGITDKWLLESTSLAAATIAQRLLKLPPWHVRLLLFGVECAASLWRVAYGLMPFRRSDPQREIAAFETMPLIAAPLLKLYRSLIAVVWFELPEVLAALGLAGMDDDISGRAP